MKIITCLVALAMCAVALAGQEKAKAMVAVKISANLEDLPEGYTNPLDVADMGAAPALSSNSMRFAEQMPMADSGFPSSSSNDDPSEYDAKIQDAQNKIKAIDVQLKEAQSYARRVTELQAQKRDLQENLDSFQKEKEKIILESKLAQQMVDLNQVAGMSRDLRSKYEELKRTQDLIRSRLTGTRTSLQELDNDQDDSDVVMDDGEQIAAEMDAMHKAQAQILSASHFKNLQSVKANIKMADSAHNDIVANVKSS